MGTVVIKKLGGSEAKIACQGIGKLILFKRQDALKNLEDDKVITFNYDPNNSEACIKGIVEWCRYQKIAFPTGMYGVGKVIFGKKGIVFDTSFFTFRLKKPSLPFSKKYPTIWR